MLHSAYRIVGSFCLMLMSALSESDMEDLKLKFERAKNSPVRDEEILSDLRRVSSMLNSSKVTAGRWNYPGSAICRNWNSRE